MKKKAFIAVSIVLSLTGALLGACTPNGDTNHESPQSIPTPSQVVTTQAATAITIEPATAEKATGFRMVSDGESIYYCQYEEPGLRKISADLSSEVLLADGDCDYLNLVDDMVYYVVPGSGIWQMKTDGSEQKQIEFADDAAWLDYDDGVLYFLQENNLYRYDLQSVGVTLEELEEEFGAAAESEASGFFRSEKISDEYVDSLAAAEGRLFYTADVGDDNHLFLMDPATGASTKIASGVNHQIFIENGRLYFQEEDRINDLDINTRICSVDLAGQDRKVHFEELNAGAYFTVSGGYIYFTQFRTGGADNFEGSYLYRMSAATDEVEELFPEYDVSMNLEAAGDYVWFDHFSYETLVTSDYWGKADGSELAMIADLRPQAERSEFLDPYVEPYGPGESYLALSTDDLSACYKLYRMDGSEALVEFLTPNSETTVSFPSGRYTLKIAEGDEWLGDDQAFGENGMYSTTEVYQFDTGYTYEIVGGTTGDFSTDSLEGFLN